MVRSKVTRRAAVVGALAATVLVTAGSGSTQAVGSSGTLTVHEGNYYVESAGAVVEGLEIRGRLIIKANDVTVRNVRVVGSLATATTDTLIDAGRGTSGVRIMDTTVRPTLTGEFAQGIRGWGFTAERVDISNVTDGVMVTGANTTVRDSTIHDLYIGPSSTQDDGTTHTDSIQVEGGANLLIERNTLSGANTAAIMVTQNAGRVSSLSIRNNRLNDGSCSVNLDEKGKGPFVGVSITDNVFGPTMNGNLCQMRLPNTSKPIVVTGNSVLVSSNSPTWF